MVAEFLTLCGLGWGIEVNCTPMPSLRLQCSRGTRVAEGRVVAEGLRGFRVIY